MKFRTEIDIKRWTNPLDYSHKILCLGSCFARNIAELLEHNKFRVTTSPTGTLFNPASIALTMRLMSEGYTPKDEDIVELDGSYLSYKFHSDISADSPEALTDVATEALDLRVVLSLAVVVSPLQGRRQATYYREASEWQRSLS